jgi:chromosome segregation ATPase
MNSLASIEDEITNILAVAEELEDAQPQALEYLDSLALQEAEKVDAISHVVRRRKNQIEWLQDEERRIRQRRQAMERRIEAVREYLVRLLSHYGVKSLKGNYGVCPAGHMSVDVTDISECDHI